MEDYDIDYERSCPECGHEYVHHRDCAELMCENGWIDDSAEWYEPDGSIMEKCSACLSSGIEIWCPNCGANLSDHDFHDDEPTQEPEDPNQLKLF